MARPQVVQFFGFKLVCGYELCSAAPFQSVPPCLFVGQTKLERTE